MIDQCYQCSSCELNLDGFCCAPGWNQIAAPSDADAFCRDCPDYRPSALSRAADALEVIATSGCSHCGRPSVGAWVTDEQQAKAEKQAAYEAGMAYAFAHSLKQMGNKGKP